MNWYKTAKTLRPYKIYMVVGDEMQPITDFEDVTVDAASPNDAFWQFMEYPAIQDIRDMFELVTKVDLGLHTQRQNQKKEIVIRKKQQKKEDDERIQEMWWNQ